MLGAMRARWAVVALAIGVTHSAVAEAQPAAPAPAPAAAEEDGFAGPQRVSFNVGFPDELVGFGFGHTIGHRWRAELLIGTLGFAVSGAVRVQHALFRSGIVVVALGVQAGAAYAEDFFCCGGPKSNRTLGARAILELGRTRGWGFVAEAGADGYLSDDREGQFWGDDTIFDAYAEAVPAFSLRATYSFGHWGP
jgi:hypothetical protein